jgi:hypothetical protein
MNGKRLSTLGTGCQVKLTNEELLLEEPGTTLLLCLRVSP